MGERSYLSIGDVLALLREEFPDVTISKIRFLESRGLLVPERTPSGYRKFYDHDVDRLRWILRQQREHFLPLKVIKGRLEGAEASSQAESLFDTGEPPPEELVGPARSALSSLQGRNGTRHPSAAYASSEAEPGRVATMARSRAGGTGDGEAAAEEAPAREPRRAERAARSDVPPATEERESSEEAREPAARRRRQGPTEPPEEGGVTFTVNELAQASGLTPSQVEQLESFGLIEGRTVAGVHCFAEESVVVAELAASFARFGIEARHLRIFKHAAERQSGLYSQVVLPLLRQRNPTARSRAADDLEKLSELGAGLQAAFLKALLRDLTGG